MSKKKKTATFENKRTKKALITVVVLVVITTLVLSFLLINSVSINSNAGAELYYTHDGLYIVTNLTDEESFAITEILDGKSLIINDPGLTCVFDDNIYISFEGNGDEKIFYIACDGCPFIRYKNKNLPLSKEEMDIIHDILERYGATFPCI